MIILFLITGWALALTLGVFYWVERDSHSMTRNWLVDAQTKASGWECLCVENAKRAAAWQKTANTLSENLRIRDETLRDEIERQHFLRDEANDDWCELFEEFQKLQWELDLMTKNRAGWEKDYWKKCDELKASKDKLELFKRESAEKISQLEINLLDVTSLCEKLCLDSNKEVESLKSKLVRANWNLRQIKRPSRAVKAALGLLS